MSLGCISTEDPIPTEDCLPIIILYSEQLKDSQKGYIKKSIMKQVLSNSWHFRDMYIKE